MHGAIGKPRIQEELDGDIKIYSYEGWVEELKKRKIEAEKAQDGLVDIEEAEKEVLSLPDQVEDELSDNSTQENG